jgi:DNA adenine methylase
MTHDRSGYASAAECGVSVTRPALRWHGGKWNLAPWVIGFFPPHRCYVEPYGGAASVLIRKPRSHAEVYNDLDGDAVNLFRVLRSDQASDLIDALRLTPFAREEFVGASELSDDPVERARRLVIRSFMGFGSNGHNIHRKTGFRANSNRSGTTPARDWLNYPDALASIVERLSGVIVENRDAAQVMAAHDSPETLHYVDPPYVPETRSIANKYDLKHAGGMYAHEMDTADHTALLEFLPTLTGTVILSGYAHPSYDAALGDWCRVERKHLADGARARTEVLWINRANNRNLLGEAA